MKHIILALASLVLLGAVFVVPVKINSKEDAKNLSFGYPFAFVEQDFSTKSFISLPWYQNFEIKRSVAEFSWAGFTASFASFFLGLELVVFILELVKWRIRVFFRKRKERKNSGRTAA
ncbi:MAG: hypothetical protein Q8L10_05180 [Candidatus Moranbacteria bacterium]|nr:hypothetical protein [Candidatus Moranbacteria bacterium]